MTFATDKVVLGYLPSYLRIAADIGVAGRVCELGVWHGDSLVMWQALFPAGIVAGVDRHESCTWPPGAVKLVCEQDDPALPAALVAHSPSWDLVVDDCSHDGAMTRRSFELLWPLVRPGGWYVVEDWQVGLPSYPGDDSMLRAVQDLLLLLEKGTDVDSVTFRYGMAMVRKAAT